jgi:hypothetical protein
LGSKIIMDNVRNNYIHVGVDPYGDLEYQHYDDQPNRSWIGHEPGSYIQILCETLCYMILNLIVMKVNLLYAT